MAKSILDRAKVHEKKSLGHPDGDAAETKFPRPNPGQLPYLDPRDAGPRISSNTGNRGKK